MLFYISKNILKIKFIIFYIELHFEFYKNENYLLLCNNNNIKKYIKSKNPKISIISPIYNSEKYVLRLIKSIQNQNFVDIEIILVDDCSIDKSVKNIEKYKEKDKRIILIKNKKNRGTFMNRNLGVFFSKGKYLILPDPDDILSKDILFLCYKFAEKFNCEIIKYNMYVGNRKVLLNSIVNELINKKL